MRSKSKLFLVIWLLKIELKDSTVCRVNFLENYWTVFIVELGLVQ